MKKKHFKFFGLAVIAVISLFALLHNFQNEGFSSSEIAQEKLFQLCEKEAPVLHVDGVNEIEKPSRMADLFKLSFQESQKTQVCMLEVIDGVHAPSTRLISEVKGLRTHRVNTEQVKATFHVVYFLDEESGENQAFVISRFIRK